MTYVFAFSVTGVFGKNRPPSLPFSSWMKRIPPQIMKFRAAEEPAKPSAGTKNPSDRFASVRRIFLIFSSFRPFLEPAEEQGINSGRIAGGV